MKKFVLSLIALSYIAAAFAQGISFTPKIAKGQGPANYLKLEAKSLFANNSSDSLFEWEILSITSPSEWEFGMCDPFNCLTNLTVGTKNMFIMSPGKTGEFIGDFVINNKVGSGTAKIRVYVYGNPSGPVGDTLEYQLNAWPTAVKEVNAAKEFSFYPNPAKDHLTIKYPSKEVLSIHIYNVLGTRVKSVAHQGNETEISLSDLQNGVYFIRFQDGKNTFSRVFNKAE